MIGKGGGRERGERVLRVHLSPERSLPQGDERDEEGGRERGTMLVPWFVLI